MNVARPTLYAFLFLVPITLDCLELPSFSSSAFGQMNETVDIRTVDGLKQRRLFDLAILHAESVLKQTDRPVREHVQLAVMIIETHARRAALARGQLRDQYWDMAAGAASRFLNEFAGAPGEILVHVQSTLIHQARIEQLVREIDADMAAANATSQAQQLARQVQRELEVIRSGIDELINRPAVSRPAGALTTDELLTLRYNIEYQAARALRLGGELYSESERASRNDVLLRVEQQLSTVLQSVRPDQSLWWIVQAERLAVAHATGEQQLVESILTSLPEDAPDQDSLDRIQAERIRIRLDQNRMADAVRIAGDEPVASGLPEFDLARVRVFAAMAASSRDADSVWQQRALELNRQIDAAHGDYWGRRASLVVVGLADRTDVSASLDLLVRVADEARRKRQWNEAVKALDAVSRQALTEDDRELAWRSGFQAAAIEQQQQRFQSAADRFETLSSQMPDYPAAHAAHLMACWNHAKTIDGNRDRFNRYEQLLEFNVQSWPRSSSADQARIWLAAVRGQQREYGPALMLLINVNPANPLFASALKNIRQLLPRRVNNNGEPNGTRELLSALVRQLQSVADLASSDPNAGPDEPAMREIHVLLAELRWFYGLDQTMDVSVPLAAMIENSDSNPDRNEWIAVYLAGMAWEQHSLDDARPWFDRFQPTPLALERLRLGLQATLREESPAAGCQMYLLEAIRRFSASIDALPKQQQYQWSLAHIRAIASLDPANAVELASGIADRHPANMEIQRQLGELLVSRSNSDESRREVALKQWRKIAAGSRPQSENWFEAKLHVARLLVATGAGNEARKMLEYIRAVPPGWSQSARASEFEQLLAETGGAP